ncbi:MAG: 6-hydroxymethylpterin diphosphokinase MptE-like protein [Anaerolineaceae bacterium]
MSSLKSTLKQILPEPMMEAGREIRDDLIRLKDWPDAMFNPERQDSIRKINALRDKHAGERCIIIGNGPSLKNTDLTKLRNENTIGMNRIYLAFPDLGFTTKYYLSVNDLVVEQCAEDIKQFEIPCFISWRGRQWVPPSPNLHYLYTTYTGPKFATNAAGRLWEGATVTFVAMQLAFHLGFKQVVLIGVDHNFETKGKPNETVVSQGDDPNHFSPAYFGKGFRWQLPDLDTSERGYTLAREAYRSAGREIIDATVGGKLTVFPKVTYESLF